MNITKEKFLERVVKLDSCWDFLCRKAHGYSRVCIDRKPIYAHRVSYYLFNGPLIEGLVVDHKCNNPFCVNPDHLQQITQAENIYRGSSLSAKNKKKTHCKRGHALSGENLILVQGGRRCRKCANKSKRESLKRCQQLRDDSIKGNQVQNLSRFGLGRP